MWGAIDILSFCKQLKLFRYIYVPVLRAIEVQYVWLRISFTLSSLILCKLILYKLYFIIAPCEDERKTTTNFEMDFK